MSIATELSQFVILAICIFLSPIDSSFSVQIDAIESGNNVEILSIMHESAGSGFIAHEMKPGKDPSHLFDITHEDNTYGFTIPGMDEQFPTNLNEYFGPKEIKELIRLRDGEIETIELSIQDGSVLGVRSGSVLYVLFSAYPGTIFAIHE